MMKLSRISFGVQVLAFVAPMLVACGVSDQPTSSKDDGPGEAPADQRGVTRSASTWSCGAKKDAIVCDAALTGDAASVKTAYACTKDEVSARCPGSKVLETVQEALANAPNVGKAWACLVTGTQQHECVLSLAAKSAAAPSSGSSDPSSGESGGETGTGGCDCDSKPTPPESCAPTDWEPYFQKLSSFEYTSHGVEITFPQDIFDTSKTLGEIITVPKSNPGAPSCHEGEWAMRQQAWLDAVTQGCENLSDAITVMCQQAADYAPNCGACNATGSW